MAQGPDQPNAIGSTTPPWGVGAAPPAPVDSVFGRVGAVVAVASDYDASQVDNDSGVAGATVADALDTLAAVPPAPVDSVFGRVGAVVAAASDYDASQVDNDSGVAGATVADALDALAANPPTRDIFYPAQMSSDVGDYRVTRLSENGSMEFNFRTPGDFTSLLEVSLICAPDLAVVAGNIDLSSDYGEQGQSLTQFQETDTTTTYNLTALVWNALDLSTVFSSLAPNMYCGVFMDNNLIGSTISILGIRLRYA